MEMVLNLRDVEVFHAVMMTGGVGRAAGLLETSQPTVSRTIAKLETTCGFRLFDRVRGRLTPTREGQLLFAEVKANLVGLDRLKQTAVRIRELGDGVIRVASLAALGHGIVPRAIARFSRAHPNVSISYQVRTSSVVRDLIATGRFDVGLAADEVNVIGVDHTVFATPRAVCVVPKQHRLAGKKQILPRDLDGESLIALAPEDTARRAMDAAFTKAGITPKVVIETPYSLTVAALVQNGAGVGLVNPYALEGFDTSELSIRAFEPAIYFRALLLRPPGAPTSIVVSAFIKALYQEQKAVRARRQGG